MMMNVKSHFQSFPKENKLASIAHSVYDGIIDKRRKISG
jgi:hypothetical protein